MDRRTAGAWGVVTGAEMSALDRQAIEEYRIPAAALMERAGAAVAEAVAGLMGNEVEDARVHVLCGSGNNGGDGFVAARALANRGARVRMILTAPAERLRGDARAFYTAAVKMGIPAVTVAEEDLRKLALALKTADVIVDAILGTGVRGALRPLIAGVVSAVNESGRPVVAVDIPSGVQADSGKVDTTAVKATLTVSFGLPKVGHLLYPGRAYVGELRVVDIGFPKPLLDGASRRIWTTSVWARNQIAPRPAQGHKGTFGRVIVIAGSRGMAGAAALAMMGALRSGAGLVTWAGPAGILPTVQGLVPEATAVALPEQDGRLAASGVDEALALLSENHAVALGPGLGGGDQVAEFVSEFLRRAPVPVVVDADALNALARTAAAEPWSASAARVMTPHPKEASRLLRTETADVVGDPLVAAARLADTWKCVALLKGAPTIVCGQSGNVYINGSGDVALATGGTGDVLTGVIASFLAQGYEPELAAAVGAFVHGRAGELVADQKGRHGTIASDVARKVGQALLELERG